MRKQSAARKFLMMLSFIAFLGAGYLTVSVVTAPPAGAQFTPIPMVTCGGAPCVSIYSGVMLALLIMTPLLGVEIGLATGAVAGFYTAAFATFSTRVSAKIQAVSRNITGVIGTIWSDFLLPSMQQMTQQLNTLNADQSRALASFDDAANLNRTRRELKEQGIDSRRAQRIGENVCTAGTVTGGMTRAAGLQRVYNAAAPAALAGRSGNIAGTPAGVGSAADMNVRFKDYAALYCNKDDNNGAAGCASNGTFAGQDIDVAGMVFAKDTIDVTNDDTRKTVDDLIKNIAEPVVKEPVPPAAVNSAAGQEAILAGEAYRAKRQVIYDSLYHVVSRRIPGSQMGDFVKPIRVAAGIDPALTPANPSHNEVMQAMTSERFHSGGYAQQQIDEPENNQREMVIQQAFQLMQMSDQLDLMDRYALVLAAQVGAEVRDASRHGTAAEGAPLR